MLTLGNIKSAIARVLNLSTTDSRVTEYINEGQQMLMTLGDWFGTTAYMQITVDSTGLITWPRRVEVPRVVAPCKIAIPLRNQWYEYLLNYEGVRPNECNCGTLNLFDRGRASTITDIVGTDKKLRARWSNTAADNAKTLYLRGLDENGHTIYTEYPAGSGTYIEGLYLTCASGDPYEETAGYVSQILYLEKQASVDFLSLYEYDGSTERLIGYYEPSETVIEYARSLLDPFEAAGPNSTCTGCNTTSKVVDAHVKLKHVDVANDRDPLLIQNLQALKCAVQAIRKQEDNLWDEAQLYINGRVNPKTGTRHGGALSLLRAEQRNREAGDPSIGLRVHGTADPRYYGIGSII